MGEIDEMPLLPHTFNATQRRLKYVDPAVIVNAADVAWTIIKEGKPTAELNTKYATATPTKNWEAMSNWKHAYTNKATSRWTNGFYRVIDVAWEVHFLYNGEYNGKGQYLANIVPKLIKCDVKWRFWLNVDVHVHDRINYGNRTTPIAEISGTVTGSGGHIMIHKVRTFTYTFRGNGYWSLKRH